MSLVTALQAAIAAVCPVDGVSVGDPVDKATWRLDYAAGTSDAQRAAARAVIASFDIAAALAAEAARATYDAAVSAGMPISVGGVVATYALDDRAKTSIDGIYAGIKNGDGLPGNGGSFNYPDINGDMHSFTAAQFVLFAKAARDWIYALSQGNTPTAPTVP